MGTECNQTFDRRKFIRVASATGVFGLAGCAGDDSDDDEEMGGDDDEWVPERNLRVIVPWGAGGGTDTATRGVTNPAEEILQDRGVDININVENITGANGLNGGREVLDQPADGYTLLANTNVIVPNLVSGRADFSIDDWDGVCRVQQDTSWLFGTGHEDEGTYFEDIEALVEHAQDSTVQMGVVGGVASAVFIYQVTTAAEIWDNTELVSYDDAGQMRNDVISGEIDAGFGEVHEFKEQLEGGDLNGLVIGKEGRVDEYSDVPTTVEMGWEDTTWGVTRGINAKAGTPDAAKEYWTNLWEEAMQSDSYQELAEETMVDLRPGFLPADEWMEQLENERSLFVEVRDALQEKS